MRFICYKHPFRVENCRFIFNNCLSRTFAVQLHFVLGENFAVTTGPTERFEYFTVNAISYICFQELIE